jgi:hypothetical protein
MDSELDHYKSILIDELEKLLPKGSFVSYVWRALGREINEWFWASQFSVVKVYAVEKLFLLVSTNRPMLVSPELLASEDGHYYDDEGKEIPDSVERTYSASEQLAAYGRWLINGALEHPTSFFPEVILRDKRRMEERQLRCFLDAHQTLSYSLRMMLGTGLSAEENKKATYLSNLGKSGAAKRHGPMTKLKAWTIQRYQEGEWASANKAAHALKTSVMEYGKTIGAHLSEENAQRTIADWIRKSV